MGFERRKVAWESNTDECRETGGEGGGENRVCVERSARARAPLQRVSGGRADVWV